VPHNVAFVLATTEHGSMIVNRHDYRMTGPGQGYGVGYQLLNYGAFDQGEVSIALKILMLRQKHHGAGVVALDVGANIGCHAVSWACALRGIGQVVAIEAQERLYYALCGNIAMNNCSNARALFAAVGAEVGHLDVPVPDYDRPGSFGSLEMRQRAGTEYIGQSVSYAPERLQRVPMTTIDALELPRCDFLKLDVEGMEADAIAGAAATLEQHRPALMIELIKSGDSLVTDLQARGYHMYPIDMGAVAIHGDDPMLADWT
jgi:FkbM family methyltransferase